MSEIIKAQSSEETSRSASPRRWLAIAAIFAGVLLIWIASPFVMKWFFSTWAERGVVGDSFGAVNALFSGMAFAGVVVALWLQREQMRIQSHEFQLNLSALTTQIREMQIARERQSQPLLTVSLPEYIIFKRPRIAAPGIGSGAISTLPIQLKFYNASSDPALNVKVKATLQGVGSSPEQKLDMLPLPIMPKEDSDREVTFTVPHESIFNSHEAMINLGQDQVNANWTDTDCMRLKLEIFFQNTAGAYFLSEQTFALIVKKPEDAEALRQWIAEWRSPDSETHATESPIQSIMLAGYSIPSTFSYKPIDQEAYSAVA